MDGRREYPTMFWQSCWREQKYEHEADYKGRIMGEERRGRREKEGGEAQKQPKLEGGERRWTEAVAEDAGDVQGRSLWNTNRPMACKICFPPSLACSIHHVNLFSSVLTPTSLRTDPRQPESVEDAGEDELVVARDVPDRDRQRSARRGRDSNASAPIPRFPLSGSSHAASTTAAGVLGR